MSLQLSMEGVVAGYFRDQPVLHGVSLTAQPGRITVILGPNGSGKSTTLRVLYGLIRPWEGKVTLNSRDITHLPVEERLRDGIAFLPQGRSVFPALTVHENLELGAWVMRGNWKSAESAIEGIYERFKELRRLRSRPAGLLSGGQQRILELARMRVAAPKVVLIDEPTVGLAPALADDVYEEIASLRNEGRTVVLVDQNIPAAVSIADYVYTLELGKNHREGSRDQFEGGLEALIREWLRL